MYFGGLPNSSLVVEESAWESIREVDNIEIPHDILPMEENTFEASSHLILDSQNPSLSSMVETLPNDIPIGSIHDDLGSSQHASFSYEDLEWEARSSLFKGARVSCLSSILLLNNLQARYGVSDTFMNALYDLLHSKILPSKNVLPKTRGEAQKVLKSIGMDYKIIHACQNDCILF